MEERVRQLRALAAATAAHISARNGNHARAGIAGSVAPPAKRRCFADGISVRPTLAPELLELGFGLDEDGKPIENEVVQVPDALVGLFIGSKGSGIKRVMQETHCQITVGKLPDKGKRKICLTGTEQTRALAKERIDQFVAVAEAEGKHHYASEVLELPEYFAKDIIGPKGSTLKQIRQSSGAFAIFDPVAVANVKKLNIRGSAESIKKAREQVERILLDLHRRQGLFNTELEEKFRDQMQASMKALAPFGPTATALPLGVAPDYAVSTCFTGLEATNAVGTLLPMQMEELLAWASYYASDVESVNHYNALVSSGVRVGAVLFGSLSCVRAPL